MLIANAEGTQWCDAAQRVGAALDINLKTVRVAHDGDALDTDRNWQELSGVGEEGAVLVRPDGFVAWRSAGVSADPVAELDAAMRQIIHR